MSERPIAEDVRWFAEWLEYEMAWCPTLQTPGHCFSLPLVFNAEEECWAFIATIPAGAQSDGSGDGPECPHGFTQPGICLLCGGEEEGP